MPRPSTTIPGSVLDRRRRPRSRNAGNSFTKKFGVPAFASTDELFAVDRTGRGGTGGAHPSPLCAFCAIERHPWKLLLCEKPIAQNLDDARAYGRADRRIGTKNGGELHAPHRAGGQCGSLHDPDGTLGEVYKGTVWYSKGMLNNGSHFVDLLTHWLGEVRDVRVLSDGRVWNGVDPEPDVRIMFGATEVYFLSGREERFNVAEVELLGTEGKISYGQKRAEDPPLEEMAPIRRIPDSLP